MATRVNQSNYVKTALRLPPELHAKLHEAAEQSGRTYNAELVARLQGSFDPLPMEVVRNRLAELFHFMKTNELVPYEQLPPTALKLEGFASKTSDEAKAPHPPTPRPKKR